MSLPRHTRLHRGAPIRRGGRLRRDGGGLKKVGKVGRRNARALGVFKRECARLGIERCELRFEGCTGTENLTWAHGRKRRHLKEGELETFAVVACASCHWKAEKRGEPVMTPIIERCIAGRGERRLQAA